MHKSTDYENACNPSIILTTSHCLIGRIFALRSAISPVKSLDRLTTCLDRGALHVKALSPLCGVHANRDTAGHKLWRGRRDTS